MLISMASRIVSPKAAISAASPGRSTMASAWSRVAFTIAIDDDAFSITDVHLRNEIEDRDRQRIALPHEQPAIAVPFRGNADLPLAAVRHHRAAERFRRSLLDLGQCR